MAKNVVFHIGDPTTGTSSIQKTLHDKSWTCAAVSVDYYVQSRTFPVVSFLAGNGQRTGKANGFGAFSEWLDRSRADVGVISAEQFSRVDPVVLNEAIMTHMPGHVGKARVIAYVRPHAHRFLLAFAQRTKIGDFQESMEAFFSYTKRQQSLYYLSRFAAWKNVFGKNFFLRPVRQDELHDGDVVADFLHLVLEQADFQLKTVTHRTEALSLEALSGVRDVQIILQKRGIPAETRHAVGNQLGRALDQIAPNAGTKLRLNADLYQRVAKTYRADAQALDLEFFERQPMTSALEDAAQELDESSMGIDAPNHFPIGAVSALRDDADGLAALFASQPGVWRKSLARKRAPEVKPAPLPEEMQHVVAVNARIANIVATIAGSVRMISS